MPLSRAQILEALQRATPSRRDAASYYPAGTYPEVPAFGSDQAPQQWPTSVADMYEGVYPLAGQEAMSIPSVPSAQGVESFSVAQGPNPGTGPLMGYSPPPAVAQQVPALAAIQGMEVPPAPRPRPGMMPPGEAQMAPPQMQAPMPMPPRQMPRPPMQEPDWAYGTRGPDETTLGLKPGDRVYDPDKGWGLKPGVTPPPPPEPDRPFMNSPLGIGLAGLWDQSAPGRLTNALTGQPQADGGGLLSLLLGNDDKKTPYPATRKGQQSKKSKSSTRTRSDWATTTAESLV